MKSNFYYTHLSQAHCTHLGGKASNLNFLSKQGFNVPPGYVIYSDEILETTALSEDSVEQIDNKQEKVDLQSIWDNLKKEYGAKATFAVRSSANVEDGSHHSFAGQFVSYLNVQGYEEFVKAVDACINSKDSDTVVSYCQQKGIDVAKVAVNVVVQVYIHADYAGVCFSVNPLTGKDTEMTIESVKGSGEKLVQGEVNPAAYCINWYDETVTTTQSNPEHNLSETLLDKLSEVCLKIQQGYGSPQDIEWVVKDNVVFIVQSRPLTSITYKVEDDWTNADFKDGGVSSEVATPMMCSLYKLAFENTLPSYLKSVHLNPIVEPKHWLTQFMLYPYWNLSAIKDGVKKIPGFIERDFDEDLGVDITYQGKGEITKMTLKSIFNGLRIITALKKSIRNTIRKAEDELVLLEQTLNAVKNLRFNGVPKHEIAESFKKLVFEYYPQVEGAYFITIYNNSNNSSLFKSLLDKKSAKYEVSYLKLVAGLENVSHLRPIEAIWRLSENIKKDEIALAYYLESSPEELTDAFLKNSLLHYSAQAYDLIEKYGHHSEKELNLLWPNWDENPLPIFETVRSFLMNSDTNVVEAQKKQKDIYLKERVKIKSKKLRNEVEKYRKLLWIREEYRDLSTQMYQCLRKAFLKIGDELETTGELKSQEDVFFLEAQQLWEFLNGNESVNYQEVIRKNIILFQSFRNYNRPNEIWANRKTSLNSVVSSFKSQWKGIASSGGEVTGAVYIANSIEDIKNIETGVILVTKFTDPAWTVCFSRISGLITETGGVLSHGAIVSREFGIPAVLGVKNIMLQLKTGDKVYLSGDKGEVILID